MTSKFAPFFGEKALADMIIHEVSEKSMIIDDTKLLYGNMFVFLANSDYFKGKLTNDYRDEDGYLYMFVHDLKITEAFVKFFYTGEFMIPDVDFTNINDVLYYADLPIRWELPNTIISSVNSHINENIEVILSSDPKNLEILVIFKSSQPKILNWISKNLNRVPASILNYHDYLKFTPDMIINLLIRTENISDLIKYLKIHIDVLDNYMEFKAIMLFKDSIFNLNILRIEIKSDKLDSFIFEYICENKSKYADVLNHKIYYHLDMEKNELINTSKFNTDHKIFNATFKNILVIDELYPFTCTYYEYIGMVFTIDENKSSFEVKLIKDLATNETIRIRNNEFVVDKMTYITNRKIVIQDEIIEKDIQEGYTGFNYHIKCNEMSVTDLPRVCDQVFKKISIKN
jgi:BTB/POZ domain